MLAGLVGTARGETLASAYAAQGQLILTQLVCAPFPHAKRAEGHRYKEEFYPAKEHYSDNTVAIFIPKGFRETGRVDFVVHFHGWRNHVTEVLRRYQLIEQLAASGRNAVLVVPQGPRDAPDSFDGKLEDPDGFMRFLDEVAGVLRQQPGLKRKDFSLGKVVLSGHSGGYQVIASILDHGGLAEHIREVWLFDALYAQTDKFLAWSAKPSCVRFLALYTAHGGTKEETEQMMAALKQRGRPFLAARESEANSSALQTNQVIFLDSDLEHDEVVNKRQTFRLLLQTGGR